MFSEGIFSRIFRGQLTVRVNIRELIINLQVEQYGESFRVFHFISYTTRQKHAKLDFLVKRRFRTTNETVFLKILHNIV